MKSAHSARPARPARPAVRPSPDFESLDQTHREAMKMLLEIERLLVHVGEDGPDETARASANAIIVFFAGPARAHHLQEEEEVFPDLLDRGDAELVQHVLRLRQDHGWLEEDWLELAPQIEAIARGYNWYDVELLQHALPMFVALYHEHIALEESVVYPMAKRLLQGDVGAGSKP